MTKFADRDRGTREPDRAPDAVWGVDAWEGDWENLKRLWPGYRPHANTHQHINACGGYFMHSHPEGDIPHNHAHEHCGDCRL